MEAGIVTEHPTDVDREITDLVGALEERLVAIRRELHSHPEVARAEHRTTELITRVLTDAGLAPRQLAVGTGVVCDIVPDGWDGDLIAFRADIDALPIDDGKDVPYASTNPGVCHACGHDVHTTVVLGVGLVLVGLRQRGLLRHGVRLIFQPAEEISEGGALDVLAEGFLTGVAEVYALHCDPRTDVGQVATRRGAITSAADRVTVTFTGPGGHTSRPHLTADLIAAMGAAITDTPLVLSRRIDPRSGVSLIWARVRSGSAFNAVPSAGVLDGTLRALDLAGWTEAKELLPEVLASIVAPFGVDIEVSFDHGMPPTVNHDSGVARLTGAANRILGPAAMVPTEQSLGGEDFSWMLQEVPGAMARLGVRPPGAVDFPDLHTPTFQVDEAAIAIGVRLLAAVATPDASGAPR